MIYIIQFSEKLGNPDNPRAQAQFYVGYCDDDRLDERIAEHRAGRGSAITRAAVERGIQFDVVITLPGSRQDERRLKNMKSTPRIVRRLLAQQANAQQ